jgi:hypothetical protein
MFRRVARCVVLAIVFTAATGHPPAALSPKDRNGQSRSRFQALPRDHESRAATTAVLL